VEHRIAGAHRPALAIDPVEENVEVAAALVRLVFGRIAAAPARQVTDGGDAAGIAALDRARRPHDHADQLLGREVRAPRPPRRGHHVAVAVERQLDWMAKRPVGVRADRRASEVERQRTGASAGDRSKNQSGDGRS
jgi:hypothetical protein